MIVEARIPVDATVRRNRGRLPLEVDYVVTRSFAIRDVEDTQAPVAMRAPLPSDVFGDRYEWRVHEGRLHVETDGDAAERIAAFAADVAESVRAMAQPGQERASLLPEDVRTVDWSNEAAVAAAVQTRLDADVLLVGGRLFMRIEDPVLTWEDVGAVHGFHDGSRTVPLPLRMVDGEILRTMFPGRSAKTLEKAAPEVDRDLMPASDPARSVARAVCRRILDRLEFDARSAASVGQARLAYDPSSRAGTLGRMLRADAAPDRLVGQALALMKELSGRSTRISWRSLTAIAPAAPDSSGRVVPLPGGPDEGSFRSAFPFAATGERPGFVAEISIPRISDERAPVAASVALGRTDGTLVVRHDGSDFLLPMSGRTFLGCCGLDERMLAFDSFRTNLAPHQAPGWQFARAVDTLMEREKRTVPKDADDGTRAALVAAFVSEYLAIVDGIPHFRTGEPLFSLKASSVDVVPLRAGSAAAFLSAPDVRDPSDLRTLLPVADAHLAPYVVAETHPHGASDFVCRIDVPMPHLFVASGAARVAAFFASRLLADVAIDAAVPETASAADDLGSLLSEPEIADPDELARAVVRFLDRISVDPLIARLADRPAAIGLSEGCLPRLLGNRDAAPSSDDEDDYATLRM